MLKVALGEDKAYRTPISSTKGATGHCLGAAGAVEAIFTILALERGILPPTINQTTPDPTCDLDYIPNEARHEQVEIGVSNSFGFGGHNACLVFRRWHDCAAAGFAATCRPRTRRQASPLLVRRACGKIFDSARRETPSETPIHSVSRQTPPSSAIRSRRPTTRNPARSWSAMLAAFSGNTLVWIVQIPASAAAAVSASISAVPTPSPRADAAT